MSQKITLNDNVKEKNRAHFETNFDLLRFFILVGMKDFSEDPRWLAKQIGCTAEQALDWTDNLLQAGYWKRDEHGRIISGANFLDMATDTGDFLSFSAQIHTRISDNGPCWFSYAMIALTEADAMEFVRRVQEIAREYRKRPYGERDGERMISYSFLMCDALHNPGQRNK